LYLQKEISKNVEIFVVVGVLKFTDEKSGSGSVCQRYGSTDPDPDPYQNLMDLLHWYIQIHSFLDLYPFVEKIERIPKKNSTFEEKCSVKRALFDNFFPSLEKVFFSL
jgi:hypothetical protein